MGYVRAVFFRRGGAPAGGRGAAGAGAGGTMGGDGIVHEMKLFAGNANPGLAREICTYLGVELGAAEIGRFSDGEILVRIRENTRGRDVFVIQPTSPPVNDNLMELLIMVDALRRASAHRITVVLPYYGYSRQDRKAEPRVPITAKLVANLVTAAGADRVLCTDLHAGQLQGYFDIPVDNLMASPVLLEYFRRKGLERPVIISPDAGGVERARNFAKRLDASLAIIDKRRLAPNVAEVMNIIGDVEGRTAVILDDMIDTAGTLVQAASAAKAKGAARVFAAATHAVLSGKARERILASPLEEVVVTNTVPHPEVAGSRITVLSVASLLGEGIRRIHENASVSSLFA
jgi:ribose-phosphate pyrophosphokinase